MSEEDRDSRSETPRDGVLDRRTTPRGVLPRHVQTWAMLGLAAAMLLVILITGRPSAPRRPGDASPAAGAASTLPPDRLRRYQEQLTEQEARLRQELAEAQAAATAAPPSTDSRGRRSTQSDAIAEEQHRREYASLFADTVAFTHRTAGAPPSAPAATRSRGDQDTALTDALARAANTAPGAPVPAALPAPARPAPAAPALRLFEGTVIEAVLTNRLEGSFQSPVNALVTTPVYAGDRQIVVIPAGARMLGTASTVQAVGETRLAVAFHRLLMPDGTSHDLDQLPGLDERGDAGLRDKVDRHYLQVFGASIALGTLSGLAQYSTRGGANGAYGFADAFGQGMGGSLAASSGRMLDRFLNVLPSVTIREGHRLRIYLTRDLDLPPYPDPPRR